MTRSQCGYLGLSTKDFRVALWSSTRLARAKSAAVAAVSIAVVVAAVIAAAVPAPVPATKRNCSSNKSPRFRGFLLCYNENLNRSCES